MPPCRGGCRFSLDLALLGLALSVGGEDQKMAGAGGQDLSLGRQREKIKLWWIRQTGTALSLIYGFGRPPEGSRMMYDLYTIHSLWHGLSISFPNIPG